MKKLNRYIDHALRVFPTTALVLLTLSLSSQPEWDLTVETAHREMNLRNMYQRILWGMQAINPYEFDQGEGKVTYAVADFGHTVYVVPEVLGTFNLNDDTFLWADKNPSINPVLSNQTATFRKTLPKKWQRKKIKSSVDFTKDLLAMFSHQLDANGYDYQRQGNTIVFYAILQVNILKEDGVVIALKPGSHVTRIENDTLVDLLKAFHREKLAVNRLVNEEKLDYAAAFKQIKEIHFRYWLNEDPYYFPALCWPCEFDPSSVTEWQLFTTDDNRTFALYTSNDGTMVYNHAYEVDVQGMSTKVIIAEF